MAVAKAKPKSKRPPHDLNAMTRLDRVMAPKQERSAQSLQRIVHALEKLLETKSFNEITMSDIEAQSSCGIATIYARFRDKNSILAALHESLRDRLIEAIDTSTEPSRWANRSLDDATRAISRGIVGYYSQHKNLLRAVLLLNDREVYDRVASIIAHASSRIRGAILKGRDADTKESIQNADLGIRAAYALLHQRLLFAPDSSAQQASDDKKLADDLALLIRLSVGQH